MSADSAAVASTAGPASAAHPVAPVPERAAIAILGSMILLILALTAVLVQVTWADAAGGADEPPSVEAEHLAAADR